MPFKTDSWDGGYNSFQDATAIQDNELQIATNCIVEDGNLNPLQQLGAGVVAGAAGSTFKFIYKLANTWITDTSRRFACEWQGQYLAYVTEGASPPQWTDGAKVQPLGNSGPGNSVLTATVNGAGNVTVAGTTLTYVVTFLNALNQESAPSLPSTAIAASANSINLTSIPTGPAGTTARQVYRINNGTFQQLPNGLISDNVTTILTDNTLALNLGVPLLTQNAIAAPNLQWMGFTPFQACIFGGIGTKVYYSNQGVPWGWYPYNSLVLAEPGVCGCNAGNAFLVITAKRPYLITGRDPSTFALVTRKEPYGTDAPFSLLATPYGVLYWSTEGLVRFDGGGFDLLTEYKLSKAEVAAIEANAATMEASYRRGQYLLTYGTGASGATIIFDLRGGGLRITKSDQGADSVHTNGDHVFVATDQTGNVYPWAEGAGLRTMAIRSKEFNAGETTKTIHWRLVMIDHTGSINVTHYLNGVQYGGTQTFTRKSRGRTRCWVPMGGWGERYSYDITGTGAVYQVTAFTGEDADPDD